MITRLAVLVAMLVVAACNTTATPTATPFSACALVANMDELVGKTVVGPPGAFTLNDVNRCIWTYATDPSRWVTVSVADNSAHGGAIDAFGDGESIEGLGDDARWWAANDILSVARPEFALQVDLELDEGDGTKELAVAIAQAALANLP